jgi:hypothetical protein
MGCITVYATACAYTDMVIPTVITVRIIDLDDSITCSTKSCECLVVFAKILMMCKILLKTTNYFCTIRAKYLRRILRGICFLI